MSYSAALSAVGSIYHLKVKMPKPWKHECFDRITLEHDAYGAPSRHQRHGWIITPHTIFWCVITYPCLKYLLVAQVIYSLWTLKIDGHWVMAGSFYYSEVCYLVQSCFGFPQNFPELMIKVSHIYGIKIPVNSHCVYYDAMTWKCFLHNWPFVRGIQWLLVVFPHKGPLMLSLSSAWTSCWTNSGTEMPWQSCDIITMTS